MRSVLTVAALACAGRSLPRGSLPRLSAGALLPVNKIPLPLLRACQPAVLSPGKGQFSVVASRALLSTSSSPPPTSSSLANMSFVTADIKDSGFAVISIKREPVNSMDLAMWEQLLQVLTDCEKNEDVRGVIFCSAVSRPVFTAGNDLKELYAGTTNAERYAKFWAVSNIFLARLSNSPLVTVAAIKGACPAGGTCLAMACDYRIITENGSMGLNEVAIGIPVPAKWIKLMASIIGQGKTDKMVLFGRMLGAKEALAVGLVDKMVADEDTLMATATKTIEGLLRLPDSGRIVTKNTLRGDLAREWADPKWLKMESDGAWKMLSSPDVVDFMGGVMARLSKSKM
ncbi:ClpP/crotonase-like domain-containing protein [Geranomyces variabilis]|nr:ClpP/crotonase-like domain-containing protein [Geranomyces variabilis]KAJ3134752.1 hypothetical protein HDU90_004782 [Geranomyces variabilis]